jgi:AraC-like DNA-binding protein
MLRTVAPGLTLFDARCEEHRGDWVGPGHPAGFQVIFTISRGYRRRNNGREIFADTTIVQLNRPGDAVEVAHPLGGGDRFAEVGLHPELIANRPEWAAALAGRIDHLPLDGRLDLQVRSLVGQARRGVDAFELSERLLSLLDRVLLVRLAGSEPLPSRRPATRAAHRRLTARACEALAASGLTAGLDELASAVGSSPHHLSRVFRRVSGHTLTGYRNLLRTRAVLTDLQDGATCLRVLASTYGFADQSHLARVVRRHVGQPPAQVRRLLAPPPVTGQPPRY